MKQMNKTALAAATLFAAASQLSAAGLDRSGQSVAAIFNAPGTASLSFGHVMPSVSGRDSAGNKYDVGVDYNQVGLSYTGALGEDFSYSVIMDQPFGANIEYGTDPTTSTLGGTMADMSSTGLTFVGRYKLSERFSVFAGVGAEQITGDVDLNGTAYRDALALGEVVDGINNSAITNKVVAGALACAKKIGLSLICTADETAALTAVNSVTSIATVAANYAVEKGNFENNGGYSLRMGTSNKPTYLIGAAYEIPDIALRVAGTYRLETKHKADTTETLLGSTTKSSVEFVTPRSFNLEAQSGIAADTLVTFSYRWTEFSRVDLTPTRLGSDLVNLEDSTRWSLGMARRFNEQLAGSATLTYEPYSKDETVSPLGPTDGLIGLSLGANYKSDGMSLSGGVNYTWLGDADAGVGGKSQASFRDNHAIGLGLKAEFTF